MPPNAYKPLTVIGLILCGYSIFLLFGDINSYYACWGTFHGKTPLAYVGRMLKTVAKSQISFYLYAPLLTLIPINGLYFLHKTIIPITYSLAIVLFQLHIWAYQALPPTVLLLGNSRLETIKIRERLERGLHPYRVIVFLDASVIGSGSLTGFQWNLLAWDNFRTASAPDWRSVVHPMIDFVPILVIDTRVASPCVIEEIHYTLNTKLAKKTVFLTEMSGHAPALEAAGKISSRNLVVTQEDKIIPVLKSMGLNRVVSPDDLPRHKMH